jgi:hypothetical protein
MAVTFQTFDSLQQPAAQTAIIIYVDKLTRLVKARALGQPDPFTLAELDAARAAIDPALAALYAIRAQL